MPAAPKVVRTLNPVISKTNEFITMNISITNPNSTDAVLTAPFTDVLPKGMVVVGRANTTCGGKLTAVNGSSKITLENAKIPAYSACLIMVGVTAVYPGTYEVRTAAGILQTSKGNNVAVAEPVKVTVSGLPPAELKLSKSFNPAVISANEFVTMSISISNPNGTDALLTEAFNDTLPKGMMILGNTSTSCGGKLTAVPGSSKVTLTDARIPAYGACQILLGVTASAEGSYENKVVAGMLQTDKGKNSEQEAAILKVH